MKTRNFIISVLITLSTLVLYAQDGQLDTSFGNGGYVQTDFFGFTDWGFAIALQNDNAIVAVGSAETSLDDYVPALIRYLPDGSVDTSFGVNGIVTTEFNSQVIDYYSDVVIQDDQKIIAGGHFGDFNDQNIMLSRYQPNGDLDASFGTAGIVVTDIGDNRFGTMVIQDDGKILVGGTSEPQSQQEIMLVRYLTDGSFDPSFGNNGVVITDVPSSSTNVTRIVVLDDGKILLGASTSGIFKIFKYNVDGSPDTSFGTDGVISTGFTDNAGSFDITSEGKIFVAVGNCANDECQSYLLTYLEDGTLDTTIGNNGVVTITIPDFSAGTVLMQENQRVLVLGFVPDFFEGGETVLTRYWLNGGLDTSFSNDGQIRWWNFLGTDLLLQNDGKILHFGYTWWYDGDEDFYMMRYENDPLGVQDQNLNSLKVYPNPSIGVFSIVFENNFESTLPFQVTDITGKVIQEGAFIDTRSSLDLSTAQSGLYFLHVNNSSIRLVKE